MHPFTLEAAAFGENLKRGAAAMADDAPIPSAAPQRVPLLRGIVHRLRQRVARATVRTLMRPIVGPRINDSFFDLEGPVMKFAQTGALQIAWGISGTQYIIASTCCRR
jgi:hypothetical protein